MNIIIKKVEFIEALEKLNKIAKSKTLSLCDNILCVVNNDRIMLSATNLEIQANIQISGQINEAGQCLIPAKKVLNIVKELDTDLIIKTISDRQIEVLSGDTGFKTYTEDENDFPSLNSNDNNVLCQCVVEKKDFLESIDKMLAVKPTTDEKRAHITCVNMQLKQKTNLLQLASTDGFRLYYSKFDIIQAYEFDIDCMIPKKEIKHLKSFCKNTLQTEINIIVKKHSIAFVIDDIEIIITLHDGAFPDYSNIINDNDVSCKFNVDTKQITKACKKIKAVDNNCDHAQFRIAQKNLRIMALSDNSEIECNIKTDFDQDTINEYYIDPIKLNCFIQSSKKESLTIQVIKNNFIKTEFDNNIFILMFKAK